MRDVRPYLDMAESLGLRITAVTETHIHADYVSGSRQLSRATGATVYLSGEGGPDWQYGYLCDPLAVSVKDGDRIHIGNVSLQAMHTPGHTPEHLAFLLVDHAVSPNPHSLFAGDFVFVGDVGRPDLLERAANVQGSVEKGGRELYGSLQKLIDLPDSLLMLPGHGAGSACGKSLGGSPVTTLGYERVVNWALVAGSEERFVDEILSGQPEPPLYFKEMKRINKEGPAILHSLPVPERLDSPVGQLVDIRDFDTIRSGSFDKAISVPLCNSFTGWAGWVIGYGEPITFISDSQWPANCAARDLAAIGLDHVAGWVHPDDLTGYLCAPVSRTTGESIDKAALVLDVRAGKEWGTSHIKGSTHIPFGHLPARLDELPRDRRIIVHCASGGRSIIAYSILRKAGFRNVQELEGGFAAIESGWPELVN